MIFHCDKCGKPLGDYLYGKNGIHERAWIGKIPLVGLPDLICFACLHSDFKTEFPPIVYGEYEQIKNMKTKWRRYRFYTKSVNDPRPLIFNPHYPWWCSGEAGDGSYATILAYLPETEDLKKYWDDAFNIDFSEEDSITFTSRFVKPNWYIKL